MNATTLVAGIVEDLRDPERLGRVRVTYPHLDEKLSNWARLVSAGAGRDRGAFFRPERGDEVIIGFEHGDMRRPYVLGGVWNEPDPPPDAGDAVANNIRQIISRTGHVIRFDDTSGSERIELVSSGGKQSVTVDTANRTIVVKVTEGTVVIDAAGDISVSSGGDLKLSARGNVDVKANGKLTLSGSTIDIN